ncbi:cell adhesion molecule 2-like, partial [Tachysurus ichikawai]
PAEEVNENGPIIFAIRCVPFVTLLLAVCFLNSYKTNKPPKRSAGKQALAVEENEQNGQEHREQDRKEEKRNKQLGQERGAENEHELTAEEREVKERTKTEQGIEVEVVNEITARRRLEQEDLDEGVE